MPVVRLVRASTCVWLLCLAAGCRNAEYGDDLRVSVTPRLLDDDGKRARVIVSGNDRYGDPARGKVRVVSSAGSLRDGVSLVLDATGGAQTELTCEVRQDPNCHDTITVTAEWVSPTGDTISKSANLSIRTTDAFTSACAFSNRRVLKLLTGQSPAVQLAVLDTNPEVARTAAGVSVWDTASGVGALALSLEPRGATASEEEELVRTAIGSVGAVGNPLVQTSTSWDGFPAARSTFDLTSTQDLKPALQAISTALGAGATGLSGDTGKPGPFKAELVVVRHEGGQSSVVIGLHEARAYSEASMFDLDDVAGGSAVAQAPDAPVDHCEVFTVEPSKKVDFIWVVDDSCSMATSQTAVATVGVQASARIQSAQLDFRVSGVTTGWYSPFFAGSYRPWTTNLTQMLGWFRGPGGFGVMGNGDERGFEALIGWLSHPMYGVRPDAEVHIIFLTDTRDQSALQAFDMKQLLDTKLPKQRVIVSGIVCPEGQVCGDEREDSPGKYHDLIRATGGVLGSINVFNPSNVTPQLQQQQADTMNRIVGNVVTGAGFALKYRPITASLRVAASAVTDTRCDNRDIPRSIDHGWDLDPDTGRIAFYGFCVPKLGGTMVVSYKSWARFGTQIVETTTPRYAVGIPDAGTADAGSPDAGAPDAGMDAGEPDGG